MTYEALLPDPIAELDLLVSFEAAAAVMRAEDAVRALNTLVGGAVPEWTGAATLASGPASEADQPAPPATPSPFGQMLLRAEAAASSRLAGDDVSALELAVAMRPRTSTGATAGARRAAANARGIETAIELGGRPLTTDDIDQIHAVVTAADERVRAHDPRPGGHGTRSSPRTEQTWIGGNDRDPTGATYVPPPPEELPRLLDDLVRFLAREDIPAVAQAAIAHAQFEAIRPFEDGNGRTGRALIHHALARRGVTPQTLIPVSIAMAARPTSYLAGLTGFRDGEPLDWCLALADAMTRIAETCGALDARTKDLQDEWRTQAGSPRNGSAAARIIDQLPARPVLSAGEIRTVIGSSHQRAADGLARLADAGVLRQLGEQAYDRTFVADGLFALDEIFELDELADLVDIYLRLVDETDPDDGPGQPPETVPEA